MLLINNARSPTGATLTREQQAGVVEVCRSAGCHLFSDEMYRLLELDPGV